jgi:hypothetical protein
VYARVIYYIRVLLNISPIIVNLVLVHSRISIDNFKIRGHSEIIVSRSSRKLNVMLFRMHFERLLFLFVLSVNYWFGSASVLSWIWPGKTDDTTVLVADGIPLISIPYESMTEDEKFLQEAAKFTDIQVSSPLETCQHKVIMKIRTSCSNIIEEQLAKLSVNLLNCQSAVEGRKIFPCTEQMVRLLGLLINCRLS